MGSRPLTSASILCLTLPCARILASLLLAEGESRTAGLVPPCTVQATVTLQNKVQHRFSFSLHCSDVEREKKKERERERE